MSVVYHEFGPWYKNDSRILILGTIPSPKSREEGFYYAHPKNRFWKVISHVLGENEPKRIDEKKELLDKYHIALWDVINKCDIKRASDSSITNVVPNDIKWLIGKTEIKVIITTGKKAHELYQKFCLKDTLIQDICLPSTSAANGAYSLDRLIEEYTIIKNVH